MDLDMLRWHDPKGALDRSLLCYMNEISDSIPLSSEEEAAMARRIQMGDVDARNRLVKANLRFVVRIALEYKNRGLPLGDLVSAGNVGILTAAERFDETQGYRFISYAVWWVRQAILQALMGQRTVRIPVNRLDMLSRISKSHTALQQKLYEEPVAADIAEDLGVTSGEVERTLLDSRASLSLDSPFDEDSASFLNDIGVPAVKIGERKNNNPRYTLGRARLFQ